MNEHQEITEALELGFERILGQMRVKDPLWTIDDVCAYLKISRRVYDRIKSELPAARMISSSHRYKPDEIRKWADSQKQSKGGRPRKI